MVGFPCLEVVSLRSRNRWLCCPARFSTRTVFHRIAVFYDFPAHHRRSGWNAWPARPIVCVAPPPEPGTRFCSLRQPAFPLALVGFTGTPGCLYLGEAAAGF